MNQAPQVSVPHIAALDGAAMRQQLFAQLQAMDLRRCFIAVYRYNDFDLISGRINSQTNSGLIRVLERAILRGVDLTVITRDPFTSEDAPSHDAVVAWYRGLRQLADAGARVSVHDALHAKVYLCESPTRKFFAVGSSNLTMQGMGFRWAECNVRGYHPGEFDVVERDLRRLLFDNRMKSFDDWSRQIRKTPRGLILREWL